MICPINERVHTDNCPVMQANATSTSPQLAKDGRRRSTGSRSRVKLASAVQQLGSRVAEALSPARAPCPAPPPQRGPHDNPRGRVAGAIDFGSDCNSRSFVETASHSRHTPLQYVPNKNRAGTLPPPVYPREGASADPVSQTCVYFQVCQHFTRR